jgi:hypothetical protein
MPFGNRQATGGGRVASDAESRQRVGQMIDELDDLRMAHFKFLDGTAQPIDMFLDRLRLRGVDGGRHGGPLRGRQLLGFQPQARQKVQKFRACFWREIR